MPAKTHGESKTRLYSAWQNMKARCNRKTAREYHNYGGRGISYCEEWNEYLPFRNWALQNGYSNELTLDRIDVNKNYCPENCRWITNSEQQLNKRNNRIIDYHGKKYTLSELSKKLNICPKTIEKRIKTNRQLDAPIHHPSDNTKDLTGMKFGRWTVVSFAKYDNGARWNCICDCGTKKTVNASSLIFGSSQSCGCLNKEKTSARMKKQDNPQKIRAMKITVVQMDSHQNELCRYNGFVEASKQTGINKSCINRSAHSNFKYKAGGYYWKAIRNE